MRTTTYPTGTMQDVFLFFNGLLEMKKIGLGINEAIVTT